MAKHTRGKDLGQGVVELKTSHPKGLRKMRCPYCKKLAMTYRDPATKKMVARCGCGRTFQSTAF